MIFSVAIKIMLENTRFFFKVLYSTFKRGNSLPCHTPNAHATHTYTHKSSYDGSPKSSTKHRNEIERVCYCIHVVGIIIIGYYAQPTTVMVHA